MPKIKAKIECFFSLFINLRFICTNNIYDDAPTTGAHIEHKKIKMNFCFLINHTGNLHINIINKKIIKAKTNLFVVIFRVVINYII